MPKNIGMEPLRDFAKYILYTGFVKNIPYPVSGLIIAPPEHAKSSEVAKFESLGVIQLDKGTAWGIADIIQNLSKKELEIYHHFVMLDLENYASMGIDVKEQFLAFVRQSSQEGIKRYRTHKMDLDLKERKSFGFLMCTTPDDLGDGRSVFRSLSFLSRFIPFTYKYSDGMKAAIFDFIADEDHNANNKYILKREEKADVKLSKKYSDRLNLYATLMARRIDAVATHPKSVFKGKDELLGIRCKENLMAFLKAIALYHGRNVVIREDFEELKRLYRFMNFKFHDIDEQDNKGGD